MIDYIFIIYVIIDLNIGYIIINSEAAFTSYIKIISLLSSLVCMRVSPQKK